MADSYVLRVSAEELWLVSHESPVATLRERLDAYIIADDVELEAVNAPWSAWLAVGARGREWLEANGVQPPAAGTWAACSGGWVFPSRLGVEAWELILPASSAATPAPIALTEQDVEAVRILRGVPAVPRDIGPADLPAEGRLDAIAVSYTKGCYLGQEVMARLKAMGRLRRQLRRLNGTGPCPPAGAELRQADRRIGEIRSAVELRGGGWVGMGMITLLGFRDDQAVAVEGLPATEGFVQPWDV